MSAVKRSDGLYKDIGIQPEVDFSRLEYVLVVMAPRSHSFSETLENGASQ